MDYEKKYKEALELARVAAFNGHQSLMEGIFPELAESEDEKTRKRIIALVNAHGQGMYKDDILAWLENIPYTIDHEKREGFHLGYKAGLEKQGNSPIKWNKNTEGNKPQVNHSVLMKTTQGIAEGEWKGEYWEQYRWAGIVRDSDVLSWMELSSLEKQGEQKPTLRERYKNIAESEWFKKTHDGMSVSNDEEPKWTDDDFNDSSEKKVQAKSLWHDCYYPKDKDRLFLLISKDKRASIMSWNGKSLKSVTFGGGGGIILEGDRFAYIDDLEKQGEQKPADKVEPKQEELTEFEKAVKQVMEEAIECGDTHNLKADADMLLRLVQKPAWSEKDKKEYKYVLKFVDNVLNNCGNKKDYEHCKRCYDWLKFLKQRIAP